MSRLIQKVKKFLRTNFLTCSLYEKLGAIKSEKINKKKRHAIQTYGIKTIHFIQDLFEDKYFFFFDMGTLLGIIREGRLLGHDLDIDVAVYPQNEEEIIAIKQLLLDSGCKLKYSYVMAVSGKPVEDSFEIDGIKFDINYYDRGEKDICYLMYRDPEKEYAESEFSIVQLECSNIKRTVSIKFGEREINIPEKAECYLTERYGENWRVPNKNWIYWKGPSAKAIDCIGKVIGN